MTTTASVSDQWGRLGPPPLPSPQVLGCRYLSSSCSRRPSLLQRRARCRNRRRLQRLSATRSHPECSSPLESSGLRTRSQPRRTPGREQSSRSAQPKHRSALGSTVVHAVLMRACSLSASSVHTCAEAKSRMRLPSHINFLIGRIGSSKNRVQAPKEYLSAIRLISKIVRAVSISQGKRMTGPQLGGGA